MKRLLVLPSSILTSVFFFQYFLCYAFAQRPFTAVVTSIIDGDSIKVRDGRKKYEIRLYGIDAPEYGQPYGAKAKKLVKKTILRKKVHVIPVERDKYNRLVAIILYDGKSINKRLISSGLAWYYPKYCKMRVCRDWRKEWKKAQKRRRNIWKNSSAKAPWKWRQEQYKKK